MEGSALWQKNCTDEDNIKNTYLNPMSFLYEESLNLLKQEVREPAIYNVIITAVATWNYQERNSIWREDF